VLVEALVALCNHIAVEDSKKEPQSYRKSVRLLAEALNIPCAEGIESLVGLRNLLIHRYYVISDEKIYSSIKEDFKCLLVFIREVKRKYQ